MFGDADFEMDCPGCDHHFKIKFKQLSKHGNKAKCPRCREEITITHDSKTKREISDANKSLKELDKAFKNFGK